MAGPPLASLRLPGTRRPRSLRRGKGAKGGRASGFPCGAAGSRGSATPLPFPSPSLCCPYFFCERCERSSAKEGCGWARRAGPDPGRGTPPRRRMRGSNARLAPGAAHCSGQRRASYGQTRPVRAARSFKGCEALDLDYYFLSAAEAEQVLDGYDLVSRSRPLFFLFETPADYLAPAGHHSSEASIVALLSANIYRTLYTCSPPY